MDEDESITMLMAMGFDNLDEIRRALRIAKGDVNEAVGILTNDSTPMGPVGMGPNLNQSTSAIDDLASLDIDMKDSKAGRNSPCGDGSSASANADGGAKNSAASDSDGNFPVSAFYELDNRVFQDNWSIPYKVDEAFARCLRAATKLAQENLMGADEYCAKFHDRILPEAFRKLLASHATQGWGQEIQEGIYDMLEIFIDLIVTRLNAEEKLSKEAKEGDGNNSSSVEVPYLMLRILAQAFDLKCDWNVKNRHRVVRKPGNRWENIDADPTAAGDAPIPMPHSGVEFTTILPRAASSGGGGIRDNYGWLRDMINKFGERGGFDLLASRVGAEEVTVRDLAALIAPLANCCELLDHDVLEHPLSSCMNKAFKAVEALDEKDLKSKEVTALSDLLVALKRLCVEFWPSNVDDCDRLRLGVICRMLKTPHFNCRMNALKEVSRLIDESKATGVRFASSSAAAGNHIGIDQVVEWMAENRVLSVALEGNIDQVQYTDRIKAIVEFLGTRLSNEELSKMWALQKTKSGNAHVVENVYDIISGAAAQFDAGQFEHLTVLIKDTWQESNDRIRDRLLELIGKLGREANAIKSTQAILQLLWEVSRLADLPKNLVERALGEQLDILTSMTVNRDAMKKIYVMKCVEDIKSSSTCALASVRHLHSLCKSYSKTSYYKGADKATLGELNKQHEIVKLLTKSLTKCHGLAVKQSEGGGGLTATSMFDSGRFTHSESLELHLELLKFMLKEGELYLSWNRCEELWNTLVSNPDAIEVDRDKIFEWFQACIRDLEETTQRRLFSERYLNLDPERVTENTFESFKTFFESVNVQCEAMKKPLNTVERPDALVGVDYVWRLATESPSDRITNLAADYLLSISFINVSARLKGDSAKLHQNFFAKCYSRLEQILSTPAATGAAPEDALNDGFEVETSLVNSGHGDSSANKVLTKINVAAVMTMPPVAKGQRLQQVSRIVLLAGRYVSRVEQSFADFARSTPPHADTFRGAPIDVRVSMSLSSDSSSSSSSSAKREEVVKSHANERVSELRSRVAEAFKAKVDDITMSFAEKELGSEFDSKFVGSLSSVDLSPVEVSAVRKAGASSSSSSTSTALVLFNEMPDSQAGASTSSSASASFSGTRRALSYSEEKEKSLPGVIMAASSDVFQMLYHLADLNDTEVLTALRQLLCLIPTDPSVSDVLDAVTFHSRSNATKFASAASASPKVSPRKPLFPSASASAASPGNHHVSQESPVMAANLEEARQEVGKLLDANSEGMNPFRLLYNLEVLSSRLIPSSSLSIHSSEQSEQFTSDFLDAGGVGLVFKVLERDSLPADVNVHTRQNIYLVALQLADSLLCSNVSTEQDKKQTSSPTIKPTPPKRSALDNSAAAGASGSSKAPAASAAMGIIREMGETEFCEVVSSLVRVSWAMASGNTPLSSTSILKAHSSDRRLYAIRRSRDNSTGSSGSGSEGGAEALGGGKASPTSSMAPNSTSSGGSAAHIRNPVTFAEAQIAARAFDLMVTAMSSRANVLSAFQSLPLVTEFIVDIVLGSTSEEVRVAAFKQLLRLSKARVVARALNLDETSTKAPPPTPKQFLTRIVLKTPVPLWMPSCKARGISHAIFGQCTEYFELRRALLTGLTRKEMEFYGENAEEMMANEVDLLHNFGPCPREEDCVLLAGHLRLVQSLLSCDGVSKVKVGVALIQTLLDLYLFPASKVMSSSTPSKNKFSSGVAVQPRCDTPDSRTAAYSLLAELARDCPQNLNSITSKIVAMHHSFDQALVTEFEYEPAVERRGAFVGLKNAGATCYMNSVLQQLFLTPSISDQILTVDSMDSNAERDEEGVFYQLQNVFGHLHESRLKFYVPEKFWSSYRHFGQQINVREQQDAFEFFNQLVDQVDEYLSKKGMPKVFSRKFAGVYLDQKICQGCPHRYERETIFTGLNLPVKSGTLHESLDQFVKGELLEGDNAYFCEKCEAKRNTIKRLCIKSLPQTLFIQLKRFHYDFETNRAVKFDDHFKFPWTLDMTPYTVDGIQAKEESSSHSSLSGLKRPLLRRNQYDLVGVVVHSGQANAGHYYSYIKERRPPHVSRQNHNKWFKFNDTSVDQFDMTDEALAAECFGGSFKANTNNSKLPENRQRYWNGYVLVYESAAGVSGAGGTGSGGSGLPSRKTSLNTPTRKSSSHSRLQFPSPTSPAARKVSASAAMTTSKTSEPAAARQSLSELSNLLEKSDQKGLFGSASRMPASIERMIQEENLRFLDNRDVFCDNYFDFVHDIVSTNVRSRSSGRNRSSSAPPFTQNVGADDFDKMCVDAVKLGILFLFNTYSHLRTRRGGYVQDIVAAIAALMERSRAATESVLSFLASESTSEGGGLHILRPFLVECSAKDVRACFADVLFKTFRCYERHNGDTAIDDVNRILSALIGMLEKEVAANTKASAQFFSVLARFAETGVAQCKQLFDLNAFSQLVKFLLGVDPESAAASDDDKSGGDKNQRDTDLRSTRRKWTSVQSREFGDLHKTLAYLMLSCDLNPTGSGSGSHNSSRHFDVKFCPLISPVPKAVSITISDSAISKSFIRETIIALREVVSSGSVGPVVDALAHVSSNRSEFSAAAVEEIMRQYNNVSSGEMRNLSTALLELLILEDSPQNDRVKYIIEGSSPIDGLLALVKNNQNSDSCRAYQCMKTLVNASNRSPMVKEYLLKDPERWQWSVDWLRSKMTTTGSSGYNSYWNSGKADSSAATADSSISNEDSSTRTFQRTTSAQVTLDEADAILAEFGSKVTEDKESPKQGQNVSSEEMDTGGNEEEDAEMPDLQDFAIPEVKK